MSQEHIGYPYDFAKEDPIEAYWRTHGTTVRQARHEAFQGFLFSEIQRREDEERLWSEPWTNGRYALAAMVWGLILMLVVSVAA